MDPTDPGRSLGILFRGLVIGLSIAAPVGPIGVLCIRRTLAEGRARGLVSGLGAATADAIYGCLAGLGLTFISSLLVRQQVWLRLVGGVFLCYVGVRTFLARPADEGKAVAARGLMGAYVSTFLLTLTNPVTVLSFAVIFAGLGLADSDGDYGSAAVMVLGVFLGSALWWLLLSGGVGLLRGRIRSTWLRGVNQVSGVIVAGYGVVALVSVAGRWTLLAA